MSDTRTDQSVTMAVARTAARTPHATTRGAIAGVPTSMIPFGNNATVARSSHGDAPRPSAAPAPTTTACSVASNRTTFHVGTPYQRLRRQVEDDLRTCLLHGPRQGFVIPNVPRPMSVQDCRNPCLLEQVAFPGRRQ